MIQVNEYFNGAVKSLGYETAAGRSTIGVIEKGEYEFGTSSHETMVIVEGELEVQLADESNWKKYAAGQSFEVAANSSFKAKAAGPISYLCKYK